MPSQKVFNEKGVLATYMFPSFTQWYASHMPTRVRFYREQLKLCNLISRYLTHQCTAVGWGAVDSSHNEFQVDTRKTIFTMKMLRHCNRGQERLYDLQGWRSCLDKAPSNLIWVSPTLNRGLDQISSGDLFQPKLDSAIQSNQMYFYWRILHTV